MTKPMNVLLITSDQHHYDSLGQFSEILKTPNLDDLANDGTTYTRAYCPNPTCTPSRASIITGQYASQHGAWTLGTKLPEEAVSAGHILSQDGYYTGLVGKAHFQPLKSMKEFPSLESYPILQDLEFWKNYRGGFYGFDHIELTRNHTCEAHVGQHYLLWLEENGGHNWKDWFCAPTGRMAKPPRLQAETNYVWDIPEKFHYNAWIAEKTAQQMDEAKKDSQPFFIWSSFFDPHYPQMAPEPWASMYNPEAIELPSTRHDKHELNPPHFKLAIQEEPDFDAYDETGNGNHGFKSHVFDDHEMKRQTACYYGMISLMDKYIGKIIDHLKAIGEYENTLIIFTTDHGDFFGHHGLAHKGAFHFEDLIRIPMIVRHPNQEEKGKCSDAFQSLVDLAPTIISSVGHKAPRGMTGVNQLEVWLGNKTSKRDHIIVENRHEPTKIHVKTFVFNRYKLTTYFNQNYGEIFDLKNDPNETKNLWDSEEHQSLKSELLLASLSAEMGKEPMWMPRISKA